MTREPYYPPNVAVISDRSRLEYWLPRLGGRKPLGVDTETSGVDRQRDLVGGLCLASNQTAMYVCGDALGPAVKWLANEVKHERELVFQNAKFDQHMLYRTFRLRIPYIVHDTGIQSFLIDNRGVPKRAFSKSGWHGLKDLAGYYYDPAAHAPEDELYQSVIQNGGLRGKRQWKGDLLMGERELVGKYGLMDPWYTLQLHYQFIERIRHWQQPGPQYPSLMSLYENERWLLLALVEMERQGVRVRPEYFEDWRVDLVKQKAEVEARIFKLAKTEFNINSTPQLRHVLYEKLGIPVKRWTTPKRESETGPQPSTDEVALLGMKHPIAADLLIWRDIDKQLGTYANGLLNSIWDDGRIHTNFKQTGARTGRLSCEGPNLQQVPRESGARRGFIPDRGLHMRFADYSQVEMRFAAHSSNDPTLVRGFLTNPDFDTHAATAMKMWGLHDLPTSQQRKFAKIMNFAMLYGAGVEKIASQLISMLSRREAIHSIRSFGARPDNSISPHLNLAQLLMKRYFEEFPAIKRRRYESTDRVRDLGYSMNVFGRHRYLEENEAYKGFNSEIQGSAADLAKKGLVDVFRELQWNGGNIACILQIHDEIIYLSDGDPKIDRQVLELLDDRTSFRVPIIADIKGSKKSWQDKVAVKLAA